MKRKTIVFLLFAMTFGVTGCGKNEQLYENSAINSDKNNSITSYIEEQNLKSTIDSSKIVSSALDTDEANKEYIADALQIAKTDRKLNFILNALNTVNVGNIQSASLSGESNEKILSVITDNNIEYQIYLTADFSIEGIKNVTTNEWIIKSEK